MILLLWPCGWRNVVLCRVVCCILVLDVVDEVIMVGVCLMLWVTVLGDGVVDWLSNLVCCY